MGHPTYHDQIKMRDYMDRRVTPPKRVTSPTWGPSLTCKQALKLSGKKRLGFVVVVVVVVFSKNPGDQNARMLEREISPRLTM